MALYPAPAALLAPAIVIDAALAAIALWRTPRAPFSLAPLLQSLVVWVVLEALALALFGSWDRQWPVMLGLLAGWALGLAWEWRWPNAPVGAAACGALALGVLALLVPSGVPLANAGLGLVAAWGSVALVMGLGGAEAPATGLAFTALVAGAVAWGEALHPSEQLGAPLAVGLGTVVVLGLGLQALLRERAPGWLGALLAFLAIAGGTALIALGVYSQHLALWAALALGAAIGALAPLLVNAEGPPGALPLLLAGGAMLVVDNRLFGILGIGLGGLGLLVGARVKASPAATLLLAVFAARVWMQLFLARTLLTGYGIDLTHPYAFAGLVLGGLLPMAALAIARLCRGDAWLLGAFALAFVTLPAWLGYFVHVEPLASLLAGLVLASFIAALSPSAEPDTLAPVLLVVNTATTLLAAPWLVTVMNATRAARVGALVVAAVLVLLAYVRWLWRQRRTPATA